MNDEPREVVLSDEVWEHQHWEAVRNAKASITILITADDQFGVGVHGEINDLPVKARELMLVMHAAVVKIAEQMIGASAEVFVRPAGDQKQEERGDA